MAIKGKGQVRIASLNQTTALNNQAKASVSFKVRFEADGDPSQSVGSFVLSRQSYGSFYAMFAGAGPTAGTVKLTLAWVYGSGGASVQRTYTLSVGAVYTIAATFDQGRQAFAVNGKVAQAGSVTGSNTSSNSSPLWIGGWNYNPGDGSMWTVDDVGIWNGYVLTDAEIAGLRDGTVAISEIGGSATWRGEYTCDGPSGASVQPGDAGIANAFPGQGVDLTQVTNGAAAVYADALAWHPSCRIKRAYVGTSGRTIFAFFGQTSGDFDTPPTSINAIPRVTVGGVDLGPLANPHCVPGYQFVMFTLPGGAAAMPGEAVTLTAPAGWASTVAGEAEAISGAAIANHSGESCFGTPSLKKTLRMGVNLEYYPTGFTALNWLPRNLARVLGTSTQVLTRDALGKPLTMSTTSSEFTLYQNPAPTFPNVLDATGYPGPTGLFAIGWDDLNPAVPTTWSLASLNSSTTVVTERADLRNFGVNGVGQVRVFDVQRRPGSGVASTDLKAILSNSNKAPLFDNLVIYEAKDFSYADGVPVVLDRDDMYAVGARMRERMANAGSLRMWFNLLGSATCSMSEPEDTLDLEEFSWGWRASKRIHQFGYTEAQPYSKATTPYFYTPNTGSKFPATLGSDVAIDATAITITDAATAPVFSGLRLYAGSEAMRVLSVSGTTVTVQRGADGTTPAAHRAVDGIQVGHRLAMFDLGQGAFESGVVGKFKTDRPHGLVSGSTVVFSGAWNYIACTDGRACRPSDSQTVALVTGPDTFVIRLSPLAAPGVTFSQVTPLDPAQLTTTFKVGNSPQIPYPMAAKLANTLDVPDLFIAIPHMATNDLVRKIAIQVRDALDAGRTVWIEVSNETWNTAPQYVNQHIYYWMLTSSMYPGSNRLVSYAKRTAEVKAIFREVFGDRADSVKSFLNVQFDNLGGKALLDFAAAQSPPLQFDGLATAPYISPTYGYTSDAANTAAFDALAPDQALDLWIHSLRCRNGTSSVAGCSASWKAAIASYNAATGSDCRYVSYEGGLELVYTSKMANWHERNCDFSYHPNMYIIEQDFYGLVQEAGFEKFNLFCSASNWNGNNGYMWGLYHSLQQDHGRGDGTDGKLDNRLCLATPGSANSKPAGTNQDLNTVSTRGQAWLDWNVAALEDAGGQGPGGGAYSNTLVIGGFGTGSFVSQGFSPRVPVAYAAAMTGGAEFGGVATAQAAMEGLMTGGAEFGGVAQVVVTHPSGPAPFVQTPARTIRGAIKQMLRALPWVPEAFPGGVYMGYADAKRAKPRDVYLVLESDSQEDQITTTRNWIEVRQVSLAAYGEGGDETFDAVDRILPYLMEKSNYVMRGGYVSAVMRGDGTLDEESEGVGIAANRLHERRITLRVWHHHDSRNAL